LGTTISGLDTNHYLSSISLQTTFIMCKSVGAHMHTLSLSLLFFIQP
jgi:hypothetical protein